MTIARTTGLMVVSASMALVATHAMASIAKDSDQVLEVRSTELNPDLKARIDSAIAKKDVKMAVANAFPLISSKFGTGNESLTKKYFSGNNILVAQATTGSDDFSQQNNIDVPSVTCYSNCHDACHDACHGSRGWR
jgi:hypothetical protein